jgi:dUTP pyrophosphatase
MKIVKVRNVKTPTRGTGLSAGLDFYIPEDFETKQVWPGESANIPSGIRARIPGGCALIMFNKSGIAAKHQLQVGACVVDEDYQGEIHLHVMNVGKEVVILKPGMKLVQGLVMPVLYVGVEVLESGDELFPQSTERGHGGFGSTGE